MEITALTSQAARFQDLPPQRPQDSAAPPASAPEGSAPETAQAVRQSAASQELADRPEQRNPGELTEEEQAVVRELKARDREVRAHEQAHKTAGGPYAGAISYDYQRGPDGQNYAVGGSVPIDAAAESDPEDTIAKMRVVIKAALAPAEPSAQDRAVAAQAQQTLLQAQSELAQERAAERSGEADEEERATTALAAYETVARGEKEPQISLVA